MTFEPQGKAEGGPGTSWHVIDVKLRQGGHRFTLALRKWTSLYVETNVDLQKHAQTAGRERRWWADSRPSETVL